MTCRGAQVTMAVAPMILQGLLQYLLLRQLFADGPDGVGGRVLAAFCVIMLQLGLGTIIGLGYVLLLLPGLYLAARTSAAMGMAAVEHSGLFASIAGSWTRTRGSAWPLMVVYAILLFPVIALLAGLFAANFIEYHFNDESIEVSVIANLAFGLVTMAGWAVAAAVYRLTAPPGREDEDIFG